MTTPLPLNILLYIDKLEKENEKLKKDLKYYQNQQKPDDCYGFKETSYMAKQEPYYDKERGWIMPEKNEYEGFR
jgi:hypothetical protein